MRNEDRKKSHKFNGHRNWAYWNVSHWINNDDHLYFYALSLLDDYGVEGAAAIIVHEFRGQFTPDGAAFSKGAVREALAGMLN